nr:EAL domain-containing protein [Maliibacterium massiliense]
MKHIFSRIENNRALRAIGQGMTLCIPILTVGSFALILKSLPIEAYQAFLAQAMGGTLLALLTYICAATFDMIGLYFLLAISYSYGRLSGSKHYILLPASTLCAYLVFVGGSLSLEVFKAAWLFTILVVTIGASALYIAIDKRVLRRAQSDSPFSQAVSSILPTAVVVCFFVLLHALLYALLGEANFQLLLTSLFARWFEHLGRSLGSALLFVLLMHLLWFFGIHGSNVLDPIARGLFADSITLGAQGEIFSKTFFDTMVFFGGCGTLLCLIIALLVTHSRRDARGVARMSLAPVLFNINELAMFGLPVVLNPFMLIPFIVTPLALTLTSYGAVALHLVPAACNSVEWTTPILLSGYAATGSIAGSLLQLFNLALGVLIYLPFVRMAQRHERSTLCENTQRLTELVQEGETRGRQPALLGRPDTLGEVAKTLGADLQHALRTNQLAVYYQPQIRQDGSLYGVEALLRWKHPLAGFIYPPLVVALARESGQLEALSDFVNDRACRQMATLYQQYALPLHVSVNVAPQQLEAADFSDKIRALLERYDLPEGTLGLEITEQTALSSSQLMLERLLSLRELGVHLILDDFGMGHSTLMHLQKNSFTIVKLDGALVRDLLENDRSRDIISSIVYLSRSLKFDIVAEYVETASQRDALHALGCDIYQGFLYSPALSFAQLQAYIKQKGYIQ